MSELRTLKPHHGGAGQTRPQWGTRLVRRSGSVPFLQYEPRPHALRELLGEASMFPHADFLVQGSQRVTFTEFVERVTVASKRLGEAGLVPGDRVMLLGANSVEWVVIFWAVIAADAVPVLGNAWWAPPELTHVVSLVDPRFVMVDTRRRELATISAPGVTVLNEGDFASASNDAEATSGLIDWGPSAPSESAESGASIGPMGQGDEDRPGLVLFTAGTTGLPKAVVLSHRAVIANLHNLLIASPRPDDVGVRPQRVALLTTPLFHMGGVQAMLLSLARGNRMVFLEGRFDAGAVLDLIERQRVTWWAAVPTMAARVLDHPDAARRDLSAMRSISMGGAPVPPALVERLRERFPNATSGMSTVYGLTETGGAVCAGSGRLMAEHPTSVGRRLPVVDLRIDEPDDVGCGEILVRTPGQMSGYLGDVDADVLVDGWVRTGDQGRLDGDLLYLAGRLKDLIIRGGENIAPAAVEAALLTHAEVISAAVIGRPDEDLGERVAAAIQVCPGSSVDAAELREYLRPRIASFSIPVEWRISEEPLPTTPGVQKIDKKAVRAGWSAV